MDLHERGNNSTHIIERRTNVFTDDDINRLAAALHQKTSDHWGTCRFGDLDPKDVEDAALFYKNLDPKVVEEAMRFYQNFNGFFGDSGKIIWKTVLTLSVTGFIVIIGMGVVSKIKEVIK